MLINNFTELISKSDATSEIQARKTLLELLDIGINSVLPKTLIPNAVSLENGDLRIQTEIFHLSDIQNIYVVGAGKASGAMAESLEAILELEITEGLINIPDGTKYQYQTKLIQLNEARHPIPSESGMVGARNILKIIEKSRPDDLILVLISGGGSALLPLPAPGIELDQLQTLNKFLIKSGATIQEINTVRKHVSQIKGGQLAKVGYPATIVTLILSDIIGNPLDFIASGPTIPDPTTFKQAMQIMKKYDLWGKVATSIQQHIQKGVTGITPETPKPNDITFQKTHNTIIGDIKLACESVKLAATEKGFQSYIYSAEITGEARDISKEILKAAKIRFKKSTSEVKKPLILIAGGETTVTVKGNGVGGRCQEMGLSIIAEFPELEGITFAAMGTDGIDGFTDAAGVIIDNQSIQLMKQKYLDPQSYLNNNDSYNFFKELQDSLIFIGPTGTNVNDLILIGFF